MWPQNEAPLIFVFIIVEVEGDLEMEAKAEVTTNMIGAIFSCLFEPPIQQLPATTVKTELKKRSHHLGPQRGVADELPADLWHQSWRQTWRVLLLLWLLRIIFHQFDRSTRRPVKGPKSRKKIATGRDFEKTTIRRKKKSFDIKLNYHKQLMVGVSENHRSGFLENNNNNKGSAGRGEPEVGRRGRQVERARDMAEICAICKKITKQQKRAQHQHLQQQQQPKYQPRQRIWNKNEIENNKTAQWPSKSSPTREKQLDCDTERCCSRKWSCTLLLVVVVQTGSDKWPTKVSHLFIRTMASVEKLFVALLGGQVSFRFHFRSHHFTQATLMDTCLGESKLIAPVRLLAGRVLEYHSSEISLANQSGITVGAIDHLTAADKLSGRVGPFEVPRVRLRNRQSSLMGGRLPACGRGHRLPLGGDTSTSGHQLSSPDNLTTSHYRRTLVLSCYVRKGWETFGGRGLQIPLQRMLTRTTSWLLRNPLLDHCHYFGTEEPKLVWLAIVSPLGYMADHAHWHSDYHPSLWAVGWPDYGCSYYYKYYCPSSCPASCFGACYYCATSRRRRRLHRCLGGKSACYEQLLGGLSELSNAAAASGRHGWPISVRRPSDFRPRETNDDWGCEWTGAWHPKSPTRRPPPLSSLLLLLLLLVLLFAVGSAGATLGNSLTQPYELETDHAHQPTQATRRQQHHDELLQQQRQSIIGPMAAKFVHNGHQSPPERPYATPCSSSLPPVAASKQLPTPNDRDDRGRSLDEQDSDYNEHRQDFDDIIDIRPKCNAHQSRRYSRNNTTSTTTTTTILAANQSDKIAGWQNEAANLISSSVGRPVGWRPRPRASHHSGHDLARRHSEPVRRQPLSRRLGTAQWKQNNQQQQNQHQHQVAQSAGLSLCPAPLCSCTWKTGKLTADCSGNRRSLSVVPATLDPLLQVLNLSANHLAQLPAATFSSVNLLNLQRIYLSSCQLESVDLGAFERLQGVVELDLSWNLLQFVPGPQVSSLALLRRLSMRGNPLGKLDETTMDLGRAPNSSSSWRPPTGSPAATRRKLAELFPAELARLETSREPTGDEAAITNEDETHLEADRDAKLDDEQPRASLRHLRHLQELDFGQCKLRYIKWTSLEGLNSLKRLYLDGNGLSQLSGRLVRSLPVGLHQLNLEGNLFACDCRSLELRQWLASTGTPLSSPVSCIRQHQPESQVSRQLNQLALDEFVCAPQIEWARGGVLSVATNEHSTPPSRQLEYLAELVSSEGQAMNWLQLGPQNNTGAKNNGLVAKAAQNKNLDGHNRELIQVKADNSLTLECRFLALPASSLAVVWLADFGASKESGRLNRAPEVGRTVVPRGESGLLPAEERFAVLYDSRIHRTTSSRNEPAQHSIESDNELNSDLGSTKTNRVSLYGSRMVVSESVKLELTDSKQGHALLKVTTLILAHTQPSDSARYKCLATNKAGNVSAQFVVSVDPGEGWSPGSVQSTSATKTNQPAKSGNSSTNQASINNNWSSQVSNEKGAASGQANQSPSEPWLKGSASFQITMAIVSLLMGGVMLAFVLVCIITYRIKPSTFGHLEPPNETLIATPTMQTNQRHLTSPNGLSEPSALFWAARSANHQATPGSVHQQTLPVGSSATSTAGSSSNSATVSRTSGDSAAGSGLNLDRQVLATNQRQQLVATYDPTLLANRQPVVAHLVTPQFIDDPNLPNRLRQYRPIVGPIPQQPNLTPIQEHPQFMSGSLDFVRPMQIPSGDELIWQNRYPPPIVSKPDSYQLMPPRSLVVNLDQNQSHHNNPYSSHLALGEGPPMVSL